MRSRASPESVGRASDAGGAEKHPASSSLALRSCPPEASPRIGRWGRAQMPPRGGPTQEPQPECGPRAEGSAATQGARVPALGGGRGTHTLRRVREAAAARFKGAPTTPSQQTPLMTSRGHPNAWRHVPLPRLCQARLPRPPRCTRPRAVPTPESNQAAPG